MDYGNCLESSFHLRVRVCTCEYSLEMSSVEKAGNSLVYTPLQGWGKSILILTDVHVCHVRMCVQRASHSITVLL